MNFFVFNEDEFIKDKAKNLLGQLEFKRFNNVGSIKRYLEKKLLGKVVLNEVDSFQEKTKDNCLVGQMSMYHSTSKEQYMVDFDIQIFYIKDNLNKIIVTETKVLKLIGKRKK